MQRLTVGRHQFSQEPRRSYHFWVGTMFLLIVLGEAVFLLLFFRSTLNAQTVLYVGLSFALLVVLWLGILRTHQMVHEAYGSTLNSTPKESTEDPRTDLLLDKLAYVSYAGFNYAAVAVAFAYVALIPTVSATR